jgi:hypothetical protein
VFLSRTKTALLPLSFLFNHQRLFLKGYSNQGLKLSIHIVILAHVVQGLKMNGTAPLLTTRCFMEEGDVAHQYITLPE